MLSAVKNTGRKLPNSLTAPFHLVKHLLLENKTYSFFDDRFSTSSDMVAQYLRITILRYIVVYFVL